MAPPHAQSVWRSKERNIRVVRLATCCNYLSKKSLSKLAMTIDGFSPVRLTLMSFYEAHN